MTEEYGHISDAFDNLPEEELLMTDFLDLKIPEKHIVCPKHGTHKHYINSTIEGYEGHWCMLCALEMLGPSLPLAEEQIDDSQ